MATTDALEEEILQLRTQVPSARPVEQRLTEVGCCRAADETSPVPCALQVQERDRIIQSFRYETSRCTSMCECTSKSEDRFRSDSSVYMPSEAPSLRSAPYEAGGGSRGAAGLLTGVAPAGSSANVLSEAAATPRVMTPLAESTAGQLDLLGAASGREDNASDGVHTVGSSELNPLSGQSVPEATSVSMPNGNSLEGEPSKEEPSQAT